MHCLYSQTVDEQFPDEFYEKNKKVVRFQTTGQAQEALRIEFKPTLSNLSGDWALQLIEKQQVKQHCILYSFQDFDQILVRIKSAHSYGVYMYCEVSMNYSLHGL